MRFWFISRVIEIDDNKKKRKRKAVEPKKIFKKNGRYDLVFDGKNEDENFTEIGRRIWNERLIM